MVVVPGDENAVNAVSVGVQSAHQQVTFGLVELNGVARVADESRVVDVRLRIIVGNVDAMAVTVADEAVRDSYDCLIGVQLRPVLAVDAAIVQRHVAQFDNGRCQRSIVGRHASPRSWRGHNAGERDGLRRGADSASAPLTVS